MSNIMKYSGLDSGFFDLIDSMHDAFWKDPFFQMTRNWKPTDINESDKCYTVEVELPRFKKDQIRVEVAKGVLSINAKNNRASYTRSFTLNDADLEKSDVKLEDGVLIVTIPKKEGSQTKVLEIKDVKQLTSQ